MTKVWYCGKCRKAIKTSDDRIARACKCRVPVLPEMPTLVHFTGTTGGHTIEEPAAQHDALQRAVIRWAGGPLRDVRGVLRIEVVQATWIIEIRIYYARGPWKLEEKLHQEIRERLQFVNRRKVSVLWCPVTPSRIAKVIEHRITDGALYVDLACGHTVDGEVSSGRLPKRRHCRQCERALVRQQAIDVYGLNPEAVNA